MYQLIAHLNWRVLVSSCFQIVGTVSHIIEMVVQDPEYYLGGNSTNHMHWNPNLRYPKISASCGKYERGNFCFELFLFASGWCVTSSASVEYFDIMSPQSRRYIWLKSTAKVVVCSRTRNLCILLYWMSAKKGSLWIQCIPVRKYN